MGIKYNECNHIFSTDKARIRSEEKYYGSLICYDVVLAIIIAGCLVAFSQSTGHTDIYVGVSIFFFGSVLLTSKDSCI